MKTWASLLLGCMLAASSHAQSTRVVYQWKDADGVTHFSDQPQPGARKITLNGAPPSGSTPPVATPNAPAGNAASRQAVQYAVLEILSPGNDEAFFEPDVEIVVRVRLEPSLGAGDRVVTYLDGKQLGEVNELEHRLSNVPRGAHTLQSAIYDRDGTERIRSERVTFHMKQPSIPNPRNQGPALRPQPKPKAR